MITTLKDFTDSSVFERGILDTLFPFIEDQATVTLDLRDGTQPSTIYTMDSEDIGERPRQILISQLRPLIFGVAWKTLDLLFELAFYQDKFKPKKRKKRWSFEAKSHHAQQYHGKCLPLSSKTDIWHRLCNLYVGTVEVRHSIVHRRFILSTSGDMIQFRDEKGKSLPDVTTIEQEAFCRTVQRAVSACVTSQFNNRDRLDLAWWLDQLIVHHKLGALGGSPAQPVERIQIEATMTPSGYIADLAHASCEAQRIFPGRPYFNVEIHFPGNWPPPLTGRLEEAPKQSAVPIDPNSPPSWALR